MSVTLKLADEDAVVIGRILKAVTEVVPSERNSQAPDFERWRRGVQSAMNPYSGEHIKELAGAFNTAARANQR